MTIFNRKFQDPRGPLYRKMSFTERYETEIIMGAGFSIVLSIFAIAALSVPATVAAVIQMMNPAEWHDALQPIPLCPNCDMEVYVDEDGIIVECPFCGETEGYSANWEDS